MKRFLFFALISICPFIWNKGQSVSGPTSVKVGQEYTYSISYSTSNQLGVVFLINASHGNKASAFWNSATKKYECKIKWASVTNNGSITAIAVDGGKTVQAYMSNIKVNTNNPVNPTDPVTAKFNIDGPDIISVYERVYHYFIRDNPSSIYNIVNWGGVTFPSESSDTKIFEVIYYGSSSLINIYPKGREGTAVLRVYRMLRHKQTNNEVEKFMEKKIKVVYPELDLPKNNDGSYSAVTIESGSEYEISVKNLEYLTDNSYELSVEEGRSSLRPSGGAARATYNIIGNKIIIRGKGYEGSSYQTVAIKITLKNGLNVDEATATLIEERLKFILTVNTTYQENPRAQGSGRRNSSETFSVKVYNMNSTRPAYQKDNIDSFNLNSVDLKEGLYVIEKIDREGNRTRTKEYKKTY